MTQDTRKDRRVKIVSLNVRYKSATVDEFIENHSHDVSKGGIFIKTASPFPPGTLLKFEIRLSDDQSVIAGVGRVVWKRDGTIGSNERPAGMGVKFIKIDDPSKTVIDKLVSTKADAGKAYDAEQPAPEALVAAAATPAPAVAAVATSTPAAKSMPPMQPTPPGGIAAPTAFARKSTMMGIGGIGEAAAAAAAASRSASGAPAAVSGGAGMFPATNSQAEMPPKQEQTVMKQAAELLEEALKEAGGSMDEIGQNPLFATGAGAIAQSDPPPAGDTNATIADSPSAKAISGPPKGAARTSSPPVDALAREAQAAAAVAKKAESVPPTARESPSAKVTTVPPTRGGSFVETIAADKKKGSGAFIGVLVAVAAVAAGVYMFRDTIFPAPAMSDPTPVASQPPPPPSMSATASATASAADTASAAASAAMPSASASASAAPTATAPPTATQTATATAVPTATATARPTATQTATAVPTATATQTATATATATATQTAPKPTATATAVPKPKPTSDNPY